MVHRKSQQKKAHDKRAGPPLPNLLLGSYVYAKPPPTSSAKAWIPGEIVGPAGPRSYLIQTGTSQIRRNRVQLQLAPSQRSPTPPQPKPLTPLPNRLGSNSSGTGIPQLGLQPTPTTDSAAMSAPTAYLPATSKSPPSPEVQSPMSPLPPCTQLSHQHFLH